MIRYENEEPSPVGRRTIDPVVTLQVPPSDVADTKGQPPSLSTGRRSSVTAVCFLPSGNTETSIESDGDTDTSDSEEEVPLRCGSLVQDEKQHDADVTAEACDSAASMSLRGRFLVSSHASSDAFVWDLGKQRIVADFCERRGPGLALRRMDPPSSHILFHTRDPAGTVSIHDPMRPDNPVVTKFESHTLTFCPAAPCNGNDSLLVMPEDEMYAVVRDIRMSATSPPVRKVHGAALSGTEFEDADRKHGGLTSVAMAETESTGRLVIACGMESGSVFFHDLTTTTGETLHRPTSDSSTSFCSVEVGRDPVLSVDLAASPSTSAGHVSVVAIAGLAGDAAELSELPQEERGTAAVLKASMTSSDLSVESSISARLRARVRTCDVGGLDAEGKNGKPGVAICRFRPDGRMFAVGGWDRRLRIFDRTGKAEPLAIMRKHAESVTAIDWAPDISSGLIATGASGDGQIPIWRCFSKSIT